MVPCCCTGRNEFATRPTPARSTLSSRTGLSALATASLVTTSRIAGNVADTQRAWWEGFVRGYGAGKGGIVSRRRKSALESKTRKDENGFGLAESALVESMPGKVSAAWCSGERDAGRR